jgi:DNA polymerase-3 subunit beta
MKCQLDRDTLIAPLQLVTNVIERRQTLPILANVCLELKEGGVTLIGTDLEVEISQEVVVAKAETTGACTVTARKLLDICRALPEGSSINLSGQGERLKLQSGRSRYTLQTLSAKEYPRIEPANWATRIKLSAAMLRGLFEKTAFSMAQQDVRYFLNGVLLEFSDQQVVAVATDGHRLARTECVVEQEAGATQQAIVPRKAVLEMSRFLTGSDEEITMEINPDQEEASDEIAIVYDGESLEIGFNVTYLMDALRALRTDQVQLAFEDGNSGCLIRSPGNTTTEYLIMPMRL